MIGFGAARRQGNLAGRVLRVGVTVLAIGVLMYLATRSAGGGIAGILLSALVSWIAFAAALRVVRGLWRESQRIEARHAILGGCVTAVALCALGGFLLLFGSQLLIGIFVGGFAAIFQDRAGSVSWRQLVGLDPNVAPAADPAASAAPSVTMWAGPLGVAGAAVLALVCVVVGIFFVGLATIRAVEGSGNFTDFFCSRPCAVVKGLWVHVVPDSDGQLVALHDPATIEVRVTFSEDLPSDPVATAADFALNSAASTYPQSRSRPECALWQVRLHMDEKTGVYTVCFSIPTGVSVDLNQLVLNWTPFFGETAMIPLGCCPSFALASPQ
jgi:hypothetical protein